VFTGDDTGVTKAHEQATGAYRPNRRRDEAAVTAVLRGTDGHRRDEDGCCGTLRAERR
jgi:hypothetical protein